MAQFNTEFYLTGLLFRIPLEEEANRKFWVEYLENSKIVIVSYEGKDLGFYAYQEKPRKVTLDCVMVLESFKGEGVGSGLMQHFEGKFSYVYPTMVFSWVDIEKSFIFNSLTRQGWRSLLNEEVNQFGKTFRKIVLQ